MEEVFFFCYHALRRTVDLSMTLIQTKISCKILNGMPRHLVLTCRFFQLAPQQVYLLGNFESWHSCGWHLTCITHPNTFSWQWHFPMATPRRHATPQRLHRKWPKEHDKELKALTWSPNSPDPEPIEHPWDVPEQFQFMESPPHNLQDREDLLPKL